MEVRGVLAVAFLLCLSIKRAVGGGCMNMQGNELEQSRLQQLKANILAQIGPIEPLSANKRQLTEEEEKELNETEAIYEKIKDQKAQPKCLSEDFYAKPVNTFTGTISPTEIETNNVEMDSSSELFEGALLRKYRIDFQHLELPKDKNSISTADLLLFQSLADTMNQPVSDETQEVHIRVIVNGVRYFVDKKTLNVYTQGPHIFNVSRAILEAMNKGARGSIVFDILVTCSSSHDCNRPMPYGSTLLAPASVEFDSGHSNSSREPRIVLVSKNPKDVSHWSSRNRRSASSQSDNFCNTDDQVTCCLHPFNISFGKHLGIYNVHRPLNFSANYCKGHCSTLTTAGSADRNTFLEELRKNPTISIEPCCSGLEYESLTILLQIFNPVTGKYRFMIDHLDQVTVTKCACA